MRFFRDNISSLRNGIESRLDELDDLIINFSNFFIIDTKFF